MSGERVTDPCLTRGCAVAVIRRKDCILLGQRQKKDMAHGMWVFPGGGLEADEEIAEGLAREVREETGLEIVLAGIITATRSAAREGGPLNLAVVYFAAIADDAVPVDSEELTGLAFFTYEEAEDLNLSPATRATVELARGRAAAESSAAEWRALAVGLVEAFNETERGRESKGGWPYLGPLRAIAAKIAKEK